MYILTMKEDEQERAEGAYAVITKEGEKVLQLFQKEDAIRYMGLLEAEDFPDMEIATIPDDEAIAACRRFGYNYVIITPDDFVIPPQFESYDFI